MLYGIVFLVVIAALILLRYGNRKKVHRKSYPIPNDWPLVLNQEVAYFRGLSADDQHSFMQEMAYFLETTQITGVKAVVSETDRLLIAAAAIIPIFRFPHWEYDMLHEVLVYPNAFDDSFQLEGPHRNIWGMVGTGPLQGKMILSQRALRAGFAAPGDKVNVALHEFMHLVDAADGKIDGLPGALMNEPNALPWLELLRQKTEAIHEGDAEDINPYGGTKPEEFFAVVGEYFFERPQELQSKHPKLYASLEKMFGQAMAEHPEVPKPHYRRNGPCPCGSGKKYKHCHG